FKQESCLTEPAVHDDGLADVGALAIEIFDSAAGDHEVGVSLELTSRPALAFPAYLVAAEFIFKREHDHAHGRNHLTHGDAANQIEAEAGMEANRGNDLQEGKRPHEKADDAKENSGSKATEHEAEKECSDEQVGRFAKEQRPIGPDHKADAERPAAEHRAQGVSQPGRHCALCAAPGKAEGNGGPGKKGEDERQRIVGWGSATDTILENRIENENQCVRDCIENLETLETEALRQQGAQKERRTKLSSRLSGSREPGM